MDTPAIGAGSGILSGAQHTTTRGFSDLSSEDFFALLIAELQSQDPLEPTDNQQLLDQMSSIRQMEQSATLNQTLQALASEQRFGATAGLIGHYVIGTVTNGSGDNFTVEGVVTGVRFNSSGEAILELHDGRTLPADDVETVTLVENLPQELRDQIEGLIGHSTDEGQAAQDAAGDAAAARRIAALPSKQIEMARTLRAIDRGVNATVGLMGELLSPGLSVGI